jgi:hypothetical protein
MAKIKVYKNTYVYEYKNYQEDFHQEIDQENVNHPSFEIAEQVAKRMKMNMEKSENVRNFIFDIYPEDIEDEVLLKGKISDNDGGYGEYNLLLVNEGANPTFVDQVLEQYKGHEVEILIKIKNNF